MANVTSSEFQQILLLTFLYNVVDLTSPGVGLGGDPPVALLLKLLLRILPALLLLLIIFGLLPSCFLSIIFPERKILNYALTPPGYKLNITHNSTLHTGIQAENGKPTSRQHSQIQLLIWKPKLLNASRLIYKEENNPHLKKKLKLKT